MTPYGVTQVVLVLSTSYIAILLRIIAGSLGGKAIANIAVDGE